MLTMALNTRKRSLYNMSNLFLYELLEKLLSEPEYLVQLLMQVLPFLF